MRRSLGETKKFLTSLCNLETMKAGYQMDGWFGEYDTIIKRKRKEVFTNINSRLEEHLELFKLREKYLDDFIPCVYPYLGVGVYASAFGCEIEFPEDKDPWTKPLVNDVSEFSKIKVPDVRGGLLSKILELTEQLQTKTDNKFPTRITDTQSPIDNASLIWKYEDLLVAMYTNPDEVHKLLKMITDLTIKFVKLQRSLVKDWVPNHSPQIWVPENWGLCLSDDLMAILSPVLYEKFGVPYLNILSEEFDGVFLHSCGDFTHNLDNLGKIRKLKGIDFGVSEMPFKNLSGKFDGNILYCCHLGLHKVIRFKNTLEYLEYIYNNKTQDSHLYILVPNFSEDGKPVKPEDVYKFMESR